MGLPRIATYDVPGVDEHPEGRVDWTLDPTRSAILVHDMQQYFVDAFAEADGPVGLAIGHIARLLAERLRPFAPTLAVPAEPVIVETPRLWHLGTPIEGELIPGTTVLEVAAAVHPTPAVCGTRDLIRILEPEDRGLYAGLVGWMDSYGDGEWALALRGIHVSGTTARLHAGAGIVAGSDPVAEHRETAAARRSRRRRSRTPSSRIPMCMTRPSSASPTRRWGRGSTRPSCGVRDRTAPRSRCTRSICVGTSRRWGSRCTRSPT